VDSPQSNQILQDVVRPLVLALANAEPQSIRRSSSPRHATRSKTFPHGSRSERGKEIVFTSGLFADLSGNGCTYLWDQRTDQAANEAGEIETAQAVCASSAFPPLFRPVEISNESGLVGVFVDGGVLDNFALNVPALLPPASISAEPSRALRVWMPRLQEPPLVTD
jgi:hypothetical protein